MDLSGTTIDQKYRVGSAIGHGGMGTVFIAEDINLKRQVAIKVLHLQAADSDIQRQRFLRECGLLAKLEHTNLVKVLSFGYLPDGNTYVVSEFIEGKTLADEITARGRLNWKTALEITSQVARVMEYVHGNNIIHRDLKPQNIMLTIDGENLKAKVLDFGIAKLVSSDQGSTITATGELVGTPSYMSPEQCKGLPADHRSDIYATCCILYEALTGRVPYEAAGPLEVLSKHLSDDIPLPCTYMRDKSAPEGLNGIILKGLQKSPENRFQSMAELERALNQVLQGQSLHIDPALVSSGARTSRKGTKLTPLFLTFAAASAVLTVTVVVLVTLPGPEHATNSELQQAESKLSKLESLNNKNSSKRFAELFAVVNHLRTAILTDTTGSDSAVEVKLMERLADSSRFTDMKGDDIGRVRKILETQAKVHRDQKNYKKVALLELLHGSVIDSSPASAARYYADAAINFARAGETQLSEHALRQCQRMAAVDPHIKGWAMLAPLEIEFRNGHKQPLMQSISSLEASISPSYEFTRTELLIRVSELLAADGQKAEAERILACVIAGNLNPDGPGKDALLFHAQLLESLGRKQEALSDYRRLKSLHIKETDVFLAKRAQWNIDRLSGKHYNIDASNMAAPVTEFVDTALKSN